MEGILYNGLRQAADPPAPNRQALQKEKYGKKSGPDPLPRKKIDFRCFLLVLGLFRGPRASEIDFWLRVELVNAQFRQESTPFPDFGPPARVFRVPFFLGGLPGGFLDFLTPGARTALPRNPGSQCGFQ